MAEPISPFADRAVSLQEIESGHAFRPKFDSDGLIPAIVTDATTGAVLMFAWMNGEALLRSIETREAWFWSRSRKAFWRKGEESGNTLSIADMRTDCDQDVVWMRVTVGGAGATCHTGAKSCFYRRVALGPIGTSGKAQFAAVELSNTADLPSAAVPKL